MNNPHFLSRKIQNFQRLSIKDYACCDDYYQNELKLLKHAQSVHFLTLDIFFSTQENETWKQFRNDAMRRAYDFCNEKCKLERE
jgi:hypothetical protein